MRHEHEARFDSLEERKLLSKVHVAVVKPEPATTPVAIVGTLTVNDKSTTSNMNSDGSWTTSVPISGTLGTIGKVKGTWNETVNAYGGYEGPDVLNLHAPRGNLYVTFNDSSAGPAHPDGPGLVDYVHPQKLYSGTGSYARSTESGSVELVTNVGKTTVKSMILSSTTTS